MAGAQFQAASATNPKPAPPAPPRSAAVHVAPGIPGRGNVPNFGGAFARPNAGYLGSSFQPGGYSADNPAVHVPSSMRMPGNGYSPGISVGRAGQGETANSISPSVHLPASVRTNGGTTSNALIHVPNAQARVVGAPEHIQTAATLNQPRPNTHFVPKALPAATNGRNHSDQEKDVARTITNPSTVDRRITPKISSAQQTIPSERNSSPHFGEGKGPDQRVIMRPVVGGTAPSGRPGIDMVASHAPRVFLRPDHNPTDDRAMFAEHAHDFHTNLVRDFSAGELRTWRGGTWHNEWHYGRRGWWWQVGDAWYGYPEPIFPFPLAVAVLATYETPQIDGPEMQTLEQGPVEGGPATAESNAGAGAHRTMQVAGLPQIPPLPAPPAGTYRCDEPSGAWPEVDGCKQDWQLIAFATDQPQ